MGVAVAVLLYITQGADRLFYAVNNPDTDELALCVTIALAAKLVTLVFRKITGSVAEFVLIYVIPKKKHDETSILNCRP